LRRGKSQKAASGIASFAKRKRTSGGGWLIVSDWDGGMRAVFKFVREAMTLQSADLVQD
jgi:hypothetical protein